jgi:hypothetical protein
VSDFKVRVIAETQAAEQALANVDSKADSATRTRRLDIDASEISKQFKKVDRIITESGKRLSQAYSVSRLTPVIGTQIRYVERLTRSTTRFAKEGVNAGQLVAGSFNEVGRSVGSVIDQLSRVGFAIYGIRQAASLLKGTFGGVFNQTLGREIQFRETVLKAQTTLSSTNRVFSNGTEITDSYDKIIALQTEVEDRVKSIQERTIELAGLTTNDVVEVFGVVASKIGLINGTIQDAEDLAVNFAGALAVFNMPIHQARQEIGSILMGNITRDSYIAQQLGITNEDIADARQRVGGVVKFLEERLSGAMAGEKIMATGFAGVMSNLRDLGELVSQRFGAGLLDPLLGGLNATFDFLFKIRSQVFAISEMMGKTLGKIVAAQAGGIFMGGAFFNKAGAGAGDAIEGIQKGLKTSFSSFSSQLEGTIGPLRGIFEELTKAALGLGVGFAKFTEGLISLKIENLKAILQIFRNLVEVGGALAQAFGGVLSVYGQLLKLPMVQYVSSLGAQFQLLERIGVTSIAGLVVRAVTLKTAWVPLVTFFQSFVAKIGASLAALSAFFGRALGSIAATIKAFALSLSVASPQTQGLRDSLLNLSNSVQTVGTNAGAASTKLGTLGGALKGAGGLAKNAGLAFLAFNLKILAVQAAILLLVDAIGRAQSAQDKRSSDKRAEEALKRLRTEYGEVGASLTEAEKRKKAFDDSIINARYDEALRNLEKVKKRLDEINEINPSQGFGGVGMQLRRFAAAWNPANFGAIWRSRFTDENPYDLRAEQIKNEIKGLEAERDKFAREVNELDAKNNITLQSQNRSNLEKEIGELRRQQETAIFQLRQQIAQREVEIVRAAGELRIFQMEQANAKMIEGQEGASRSALEALNAYISTRERGELDIETAKQELVIESANLEKQISDYRYENEKRIVELRKRANDYEMEVAKFTADTAVHSAQTAAAAAAQATGPGGFLVGSTGRSTGPHLDIRGDDRSGVIKEAFAVIKEWQRQKVPYIVLSNANNRKGIDVTNMTDDRELLRALAAEQRAHDTTRGRRIGASQNAIDIAVPSGTRFPFPVTAPTLQGNGGWTSNSINTGNTLHHGLPTSTATGSATATTAPTAPPLPPTAPDYESVGAPATEAYAATVRQLGGAMSRLREIRAAITQAQTAAQFENIAKAAIPEVGLEEFRDEYIRLEESLKAISELQADVFDPEKLNIAIDRQTKLNITNAELVEIYKGAIEQVEKGLFSEQKLAELKERIIARQEKYSKDLEQAADDQERNLEAARKLAAITNLRTTRSDLPFDLLQADLAAQGQRAEAFIGDDPIRRRQLEGEIAITERRIQLQKDGVALEGDVLVQYQQTAASLRAFYEMLGEMDLATQKYLESVAQVRTAVSTLLEGMKGFTRQVLLGGDIREAMTQGLESVAGRFVDMFLEAAFKPMEDQLFGYLKDFLKIPDPVTDAQTANTTAIGLNTLAIETLTKALAPTVTSSTAAATRPENATPATAALPTLSESDTSSIDASLKQAEQATEDYASNIKQAATSASDTNPKFSDLQRNISAATGALGGLAMMVAGAQSMKEGGTYGTLMGLAGIFGGIASITGSIASIKGKARGGPVTANTPYMVGEEGPELFVPNQDGEINSTSRTQALLAARSALGGNQMAGSTEDSALQMSNAAVRAQQQLLRERSSERTFQEVVNRPSGPLDINFQSEVINNVEYVTADQFQRGMSDAANRGRALTLQVLGSSVQTRRKLGMS